MTIAIALLSLAVSSVACGSRASGTTTTAGSTRSIAMRVACAGLSLKLGPPISPQTQEQGVELVIENASSRRCVVAGYPVVTLRSGRMRTPFRYANGRGYVSSRPPTRVAIRSGKPAYALLAKPACDTPARHPSFSPYPNAVELRLSRAETLELKLPRAAAAELAYCGPEPDPGDTVEVSPIDASVKNLTDVRPLP